MSLGRALLCVCVAVVPVVAAAQDAPPAAPTAPLDEARAAFRAADYAKAAEAAERALQADAASVVAHYIAGASLVRLSRYDDAETHLAAVEQAKPDFNGLQFQLGFLSYNRAEQASQSGQGEEAKSLYLKAAERFAKELERNAGQLASISSRAVALGKAGALDEAVPAHEAWIAAEPQSNNPVVSLGAIYARGGKVAEATATLERLPDKSPRARREAALTFGALLYENEAVDAIAPEPLFKIALEDPPAADDLAKRAQGFLVGVHAKTYQLDQTAIELERFIAMAPEAKALEDAGELVREKFTSAADGTAPRVVRVAPSRYPKEARANNIKTDVFVLVRVGADGKPLPGDETKIVIPNRIWSEIRSLGFEREAKDVAMRSRYEAGLGADGKPAERWAMIKVPFEP
ncbi:MAG TPA: CDC27 family protein [Candidatus Polarisedimenticolaceae bacterium]